MKRKRETKAEVVSTRLPPRIRAGLEKAAQKEERSVSYLIAKILTEWLESRHPDLIPPPEELEAAQAERSRRAEAAAQLARVPLYDLGGTVAEIGFPAGQAPEGHLELTRAIVYRLGAHPEALVALRVAGDAMAPELVEGDLVLIDTARRAPAPFSGDLWLLRLGGALLIRRLRRQAGRLLALAGDPRYPPLDLPAAAPGGDFEVLGRLLGRWQDLAARSGR